MSNDNGISVGIILEEPASVAFVRKANPGIDLAQIITPPKYPSFPDADGRDIMQEKIKENYCRIKQDALDIIEAEMKRIEKDEESANYK